MYNAFHVVYLVACGVFLVSGSTSLEYMGTCANLTSIVCFFPNNCDNLTCAEGAGGKTCETCRPNATEYKSYFRSGAVCLSCPIVPWSSLVTLVLFGIIIFGAASHHSSTSAAVKVKLLMDFLQLTFLSLSLRVSWPKTLATILDNFKVSFINARIFNIGCYTDTPTAFYITWLSSIFPLVVITVSVVIADRCMLRLLRKERRDQRQDRWTDRRSHVRRLLVYMWFIMYAPVASLAIRSYACEKNINSNIWCQENNRNETTSDSNRWAFDQSQNCDQYWFQGVTFVSTFILGFFTLLFPLLMLFCTIRIWKFKLQKKKICLYGSFYEAYESSWCFMEGAVLLRKLMLIIVTDIYSIKPLVQILVSVAISLIYLFVIVCGKPYRRISFKICDSKVDVHNSFEILASVTVLANQLSAILFFYNIVADAAQYILFIVNGTTLFVWLLIYFGQGCFEETWIDEIEDETDGEIEAEPPTALDVMPFFLKKKGGITAAELRNREVAVSDF
ncbi:uncharacterized protein LOC134185771 isoform X1 [Corticium candelabrum]|uniref:uncharacterized protein LOC134185771 isoform X1 n=1 Tax=Corticium candelabrum TaxID=121492 RepID=UPI002E267CE4|nr:uncharacterized protein LOC134185771 isoform X1 [Corticium candelabrum]